MEVTPNEEHSELRIAEFQWTCPEREGTDNGIYALYPLKTQHGMSFIVGGQTETIFRLEMSQECGLNEDGIVQGCLSIKQTFELIHTDSITQIVANSDRNMIAIGAMDGNISIFRVDDNGCMIYDKSFNDLSGVEIECLSFSPTGSVILAGTNDGCCYCWHAERGYVSNHTGHSYEQVQDIAFVKSDSTGYLGLSTSSNGKVIVFELQSGAIIHRIDLGEDKAALKLDIHPSQPLIALACEDGTARFLNPINGKILSQIQLVENSLLHCIKWAPEMAENYLGGRHVAAADNDGNVYIINASTNTLRTSWKCTDKEDVMVTHLEWAMDQQCCRLVAGLSDGVIKVWDARNGEVKDSLYGESLPCALNVFSMEDITCVAVGYENGLLSIWQLTE